MNLYQTTYKRRNRTHPNRLKPIPPTLQRPRLGGDYHKHFAIDKEKALKLLQQLNVPPNQEEIKEIFKCRINYFTFLLYIFAL